MAPRTGHLRQHVPVTLVTRLRIDAALYDEPIAPPKGKRGPKPKQGTRQLPMKARLADSHTPWCVQPVPWYDAQTRTLHVLTGTAIWHPKGEPLSRKVALRGAITWTLLNDPNDKDFEPVLLKVALLGAMCSNLQASHLNMITWFVGRWNIEVTFEESRAHLGIESQRQWSESGPLRGHRAVERSTPCL